MTTVLTVAISLGIPVQISANPIWQKISEGGVWLLQRITGETIRLYIEDERAVQRFEYVANEAEAIFKNNKNKYCFWSRDASIGDISLKVGSQARGEYQHIISQVYDVNKYTTCRYYRLPRAPDPISPPLKNP